MSTWEPAAPLFRTRFNEKSPRAPSLPPLWLSQATTVSRTSFPCSPFRGPVPTLQEIIHFNHFKSIAVWDHWNLNKSTSPLLLGKFVVGPGNTYSGLLPGFLISSPLLRGFEPPADCWDSTAGGAAPTQLSLLMLSFPAPPGELWGFYPRGRKLPPNCLRLRWFFHLPSAAPASVKNFFQIPQAPD